MLLDQMEKEKAERKNERRMAAENGQVDEDQLFSNDSTQEEEGNKDRVYDYSN